MASYSGGHFYEVSFKFLHAYRRYALDKNQTPPACQGANYNMTRFSNGSIKSYNEKRFYYIKTLI
jgi:hypothetical protein